MPIEQPSYVHQSHQITPTTSEPDKTTFNDNIFYSVFDIHAATKNDLSMHTVPIEQPVHQSQLNLTAEDYFSSHIHAAAINNPNIIQTLPMQQAPSFDQNASTSAIREALKYQPKTDIVYSQRNEAENYDIDSRTLLKCFNILSMLMYVACSRHNKSARKCVRSREIIE